MFLENIPSIQGTSFYLPFICQTNFHIENTPHLQFFIEAFSPVMFLQFIIGMIESGELL